MSGIFSCIHVFVLVRGVLDWHSFDREMYLQHNNPEILGPRGEAKFGHHWAWIVGCDKWAKKRNRTVIDLTEDSDSEDEPILVRKKR